MPAAVQMFTQEHLLITLPIGAPLCKAVDDFAALQPGKPDGGVSSAPGGNGLRSWVLPATRPIGTALWRLLGKDAAWDPEVIAALKRLPEVPVPDILKGPLPLIEGAPTLFTHQQEGVAFLLDRKRALLADQVGCGKSAQAIIAAELAGCKSVLIVCPKFLRQNWDMELRKWVAPRAVVMEAGSKLLKMKAGDFTKMIEEHRYFIINYDMLAKMHQVMLKHWDCIIVDEAHFCKGATSRRSKTVRKLSSDYLFMLTGTPLLNRPIELFPILDCINPGKWGDYYAFGNRYAAGCKKEIPLGVFCVNCSLRRHKVDAKCTRCGSTAPAKYKSRIVPDYSGASNLPELKGRLRQIMIARKKVDVLKELPPFYRVDRLVKLPEKYRELYDLAVSNIVSFLVKYKHLGLKQAKKSAYNEMLRRAQVLRQLLSEAKLLACAREIREVLSEGQSAVAFTCYVDTAKRLQQLVSGGVTEEAIAAIDEAVSKLFAEDNITVPGLDRKEEAADGDEDAAIYQAYLHIGECDDDARAHAINSFKKTNGSALVCTIQTAGVGLNLPEASYAFFVDFPWTPAELFQAEGRIHRIGQTKETFYVRYFATDTYDEILMRKLKEKQSIFDQLIGASEGTQVAADEKVDDLFEVLVNDLFAQAAS